MATPYTITNGTITDTGATITVAADATAGPLPVETLELRFVPGAGTTVSETLATFQTGEVRDVTVAGLTAGTEYTVGVYGDGSLQSNTTTVITTGGAGVTATRSQWQDLAERVKRSEGVRELTAEDYNYHASGNTDNAVALWLLDNGIYWKDSGVQVYYNSSNRNTLTSEVYIVSGKGVIGGTADIYRINSSIAHYSTQADGTSLIANDGFLAASSIVDNLTSTSTTSPLSANQGRVLNEKIPAVTLTSTDPGEGATLAANNFIGVYDA